MVQRLLSARDERQSRTALLASWVVILVQFVLFLLIGVLLYVYYGDLAPHRRPHRRTGFIPSSSGTICRPGLAGLIIAAILAAAMANLSAALNSLASTTVVDFYRARAKIGHRRGGAQDRALGDRSLGSGAARHRHRARAIRNRSWRRA